MELSTRPEKRIGTEDMWDRAEAALQRALDNHGLEYELNEGDGAFYGPKIDLHMTDAIGRSWQLGTVQLDYVMPERFELTYTGADNAEHRPVMIHRALMGSFERFIGMLVEHYAGEFPVWLAPVQAIVLPVSDRHVEHADKVQAALGGFRVEVDGARSRSGARSARRSCARSRTCSCSATARSSRTRSRCAGTARATRARSRSTTSARSSARRSLGGYPRASVPRG